MPNVTPLSTQLAAYKQAIDADIASYAAYIRSITKAQYGEYVALETDTFLDILSRGGKRIRGAFVINGYEMSGGTDRAMILQAARAIEMLHAYLLIIDDIQDRSPLRRGKSSAHRLLSEYHRTHRLKGDAEHVGLSVALNAAVAGAHAAQTILANLHADPELRLKVLSIVNRTMAITAHGQTCDMLNGLSGDPTETDIERVLEWKTALYSFINPLHVGMVLADADCRATDAITPYALHAGKAFQITDDISGMFGSEATLGKTPGEDLREGRANFLTTYALKHAAPSDGKFLRGLFGKTDLTEADLARAQEIMRQSGAFAYAQQAVKKHVAAALQALKTEQHRWDQQGTDFLRCLVEQFT